MRLVFDWMNSASDSTKIESVEEFIWMELVLILATAIAMGGMD